MVGTAATAAGGVSTTAGTTVETGFGTELTIAGPPVERLRLQDAKTMVDNMPTEPIARKLRRDNEFI
jgi:hypothetical protein